MAIFLFETILDNASSRYIVLSMPCGFIEWKETEKLGVKTAFGLIFMNKHIPTMFNQVKHLCSKLVRIRDEYTAVMSARALVADHDGELCTRGLAEKAQRTPRGVTYSARYADAAFTLPHVSKDVWAEMGMEVPVCGVLQFHHSHCIGGEMMTCAQYKGYLDKRRTITLVSPSSTTT